MAVGVLEDEDQRQHAEDDGDDRLGREAALLWLLGVLRSHVHACHLFGIPDPADRHGNLVEAMADVVGWWRTAAASGRQAVVVVVVEDVVVGVVAGWSSCRWRTVVLVASGSGEGTAG